MVSNQEINVNSGIASAVATDAIKIEENNIHGTTPNNCNSFGRARYLQMIEQRVIDLVW